MKFQYKTNHFSFIFSKPFFTLNNTNVIFAQFLLLLFLFSCIFRWKKFVKLKLFPSHWSKSCEMNSLHPFLSRALHISFMWHNFLHHSRLIFLFSMIFMIFHNTHLYPAMHRAQTINPPRRVSPGYTPKPPDTDGPVRLSRRRNASVPEVWVP